MYVIRRHVPTTSASCLGLELLIDRVERLPELGLRTVRIVTHDAAAVQSSGNQRVLGQVEEIAQVINRVIDDRLVTSLPARSHAVARALVRPAEQRGARRACRAGYLQIRHVRQGRGRQQECISRAAY